METMNLAELPIAVDPARIAEFCQAHGIRRLSFFGSILREDFDEARSDVDVLVEYLPGRVPGFDFISHQDELTQIIGANVDLNTPGCLSKYIRAQVMSEAVPIYEQA